MKVKLIPAGLGFEQLTEAVTTEYASLLELVRMALREKLRGTPGCSDYYVDVQGIWPDRVVARLQGRLFSYPYTIDGDNKVIIADGTEVILAYTSVRESAQAGRDQVESATFREAADGTIEVTVLRAGLSRNGNFYTDAALKGAVQLCEGVRVFVKSDDVHTKGGGKDVRNLVGGIYGVSFVAGTAPDTGRLTGTFKPIDPSDPVVTKMTEAVKRGMQGLMGLSIDATAYTKREQRGGKAVRVAQRFARVDSVDLIVEPGAGGGLDRLTEAAATDSPDSPESQEQQPSGETMLKQRLFEAIRAKSPDRAAKIDLATVTDEELLKVYEAVMAGSPGAVTSAGGAAPGGATRVVEAAGGTEADAPVTRAELEMFRTRQTALASIAACALPAPAKERLSADFGRRERFTEADVTAAITGEREYLARFTESGAVNLPGLGRISVEDRSLKIGEMLDAFFDTGHKHHRDVHSFRECYVEITGDRRVTGQLRDCDESRMRESLGRFAESVSSTSFANALGDSITRRMQAVFTGLTDLQAWRRVATWGPVNDFRSQERFRIGGYGNLPAVAQGAPYSALTSPGDEKSTYAVTKRGGTEDVTLEAIKNDDVQALRRIPTELALAAGNTLYEFVFDFYRTNPSIYDAVALYHASHNNLFTAALSASEFAAHRLSMLKQTRAGSSKRMGVAPARVLVPFELQETAYNLFVRNQNLDKTFVQTINPEVIPVAYWTDGNDWVTTADPNVLPALEIGFLDGREDPELFVQDMPSVGSMFSNDKLTYKIRHIYGGNVLVDGFKATTKAVVP